MASISSADPFPQRDLPRVYSVSPWGNLTGATICALDHLLFLNGKIADGVLVLAHRGPLEARAREMGVRTVCFAFANRGLRQASLWRKLWGAWPVLRSRWSYVWNLGKLLRKHPGILHVHSRRGASWYALWSGWLARMPVVLTLHEFPDQRKWVARWEAWMMRNLVARVVAVSQATAQAYRPFLKNKPARVVHNALRALPAGLLRTGGTAVFAMIGRLGPHKGTDEFLTACAELRRRRIGFEAWLVGDWVSVEERTRAVRRVADLGLMKQVVLCAACADMDAVYRRIDIVVVPSHAETFSLVALEGMAYGLPVVASAVGGVPELVEEGKTGFLVPVGDARALAERLDVLLRDADRRRIMGGAGRARAQARFASDTYAAAMLRIYGELWSPDGNAAHEA